MKQAVYVAAVLLLTAACETNEAATAADRKSDTIRTVVDSILPVQEEIRRFKVQRGGASAAALTGGAASRDELVQRFMTAVEKRDTVVLSELLLNANEFIDLYYPTSQFARPPYRQSPELRWFLMQEQSSKGIRRLLERHGGQPTGLRGYSCNPQPLTEGANRIWDRCVVESALYPAPTRLFSTILERDGQFKFMSYGNGL
jgi:hypothetical protein